MTAWNAATGPAFAALVGLEGEALRAELVARARRLVPLLAGNGARTEAGRRLAEDNVAAIAAAGLFRLLTPRRLGGLETDLRTALAVARELALGCGSTSWVTTIVNTCGWLVGLGSEEAQREVWGADADARVVGVLAPTATARRVDGGLVVSGTWGWASGCLHAQWSIVGVPLVDDAGRAIDHGLALIPMKELGIVDTWFFAGMKGTGSHTLVAEEVFVPDHRVMSVSKLTRGEAPTPFAGETLYRSAFVPVASLVLVGPLLGLAAAALALVIAEAPARAIAATRHETRAKAPVVQLELAEAATLVDTAHLHAYRAAGDIDDAARAGRSLDRVAQARVRMDAGHAVRTAREAIRALCSAHGASSFADACPLQRIWRDAEVASRHPLVSPEIAAEIYGRALVGIEEGSTSPT